MTEKWVFVVRDTRPVDPVEVIYQLALVNDKNEIVSYDGHLTGCNHGVWDRVKEALGNEMLTEKVTQTTTLS